MSGIVLNQVRKSFYLDSVALMRMSRDLMALDGIEEAAMMMGTIANQQIMADAGLLDGSESSGRRWGGQSNLATEDTPRGSQVFA